MNQSC